MSGQQHAPAALFPGKDSVPILQEAGWSPGLVWTGGKSRLHQDSIPDRPARSPSLYQLSYPAQRIIIINALNNVTVHQVGHLPRVCVSSPFTSLHQLRPSLSQFSRNSRSQHNVVFKKFLQWFSQKFNRWYNCGYVTDGQMRSPREDSLSFYS